MREEVPILPNKLIAKRLRLGVEIAALIVAIIFAAYQLSRDFYIRLPWELPRNLDGICSQSTSIYCYLRQCTKPGQTVYIVTHTTGYAGSDDYYDADGHHLGATSGGEFQSQSSTPAAVDTSGFNCKVIQSRSIAL